MQNLQLIQQLDQQVSPEHRSSRQDLPSIRDLLPRQIGARWSSDYRTLQCLAWKPLSIFRRVLVVCTHTTIKFWVQDLFVIDFYEVQITEDAGSAIQSIAWERSGKMFAVALADGNVFVYRVRQPRPPYIPKPFCHHPDFCYDVCWSRTGAFLATCGADWFITVWDMQSMGQRWWRAHKDRVMVIRWHPRRDLIVSGSKDKRIKVWACQNDVWTCAKKIKCQNTILDICFHIYGQRMISCCLYEETIDVWGTASETVGDWAHLCRVGGNLPIIGSLDWANDGDFIAACGTANGTIAIYRGNYLNQAGDAHPYTLLLLSEAHDSGVYSVKWDVHERLLASTDNTAIVKVWRL